jgi:hypothetical protein
MVTTANYHQRTSAKDGKTFITLELQGDVELVQSLNTLRFYATARKCHISCTFTEEIAKTLIGTKFPGTILRVEKEPYDYAIPETGQIVRLADGYEYQPEGPAIGMQERMKVVA